MVVIARKGGGEKEKDLFAVVLRPGYGDIP